MSEDSPPTAHSLSRGHVAKGVVIGALVTLISSPISGVVGFYLGQSLGKAKIVPVDCHVFVSRTEQKLPLGGSAIERFRRVHPDWWSAARVSSDCRDDFDHGLAFPACLRELLDSVSDYMAQAELRKESYAKNLQVMKSWNRKDVLKLLPVYVMGLTEPLEVAFRKNPESMIETIEAAFRAYDDAQALAKSTIDKMNGLLATTPVQEQDLAIFEVAFLNTGNTDGVIAPEGRLHVNGTAIELRTIDPQGGPASDYVVVRAHSFAKALFQVNEGSSTQDGLRRWNQALASHSQENLTITTHSESSNMETTVRLPVQ